MKATGEITITEGLTLLNPTLEIVSTYFDWLTDVVSVECIFTEGIYKHSRTFEFDNPTKKDIVTADVIAFIKTHEVLKVFK